MAAVIIGVDQHKGSHTAVAVGGDEMPLGQVRVRACDGQAGQLLDLAEAWRQRTWAVEGARGMGYVLAQQLVAAGEKVLDVQPKARRGVRLLAAGDVSKNDPSDARSVAVAALRCPGPKVRPDDHAAVLKVWSKRHRDLSSLLTQAVCRLHAMLCELLAELKNPNREFDAAVIGEPHGAFYGNQYGLPNTDMTRSCASFLGSMGPPASGTQSGTP